MLKTKIKILEEVSLDNPVFIEALPGIGHVGKLAADHLIDELGATKFAEVYSPYFPPQVYVDEDGLIENMVNEFYYLKNQGEDEKDFIILVGNTQGVSPEGQYAICNDLLDFIEDYNVSELFTLGGLATGQPVEKPIVYGAATDEDKIDLLKSVDVEIRSADGGIIGASGLFLGLGQLRDMSGACLMGATPGYFIDPEAAEAILNKLSAILKIEVNTDKLEERAEETRQILSKAQQREQEVLNRSRPQQDDDLRYIG